MILFFRNRDFRVADEIKAKLIKNGIQLFDKENTWRSSDGSMEGYQSVDFRIGRYSSTQIYGSHQDKEHASSWGELRDNCEQKDDNFDNIDDILEEIWDDEDD